MTDKVTEKLKRLYALAKLSDDERKLYADNKLDDGRLNEARTSAFLLIHIARTNGVAITFGKVREDRGSQPQAGTHGGAGGSGAQWGGMGDPFADFADAMRRSAERASEQRQRATDEREARDRRAAQERAEREKKEREAAERRRPAGRQNADFIIDDFDLFTHMNDPGAVPPFQRPQSRPSPKWKSVPVNDPKAPPLITSQFPGVCLTCRKIYAQGEQVWWVRNVGSAHKACGYEDLTKI